jgi:hypothetical protein
MSERKPWFRVMTPADANLSESNWMRAGAFSHGKIAVLPIALEGWIALFGFVAILVAALAAIWFAGMPQPGAFVATVVAIGIIVGGFVALVRARMTRLPRRD